MPDQWPPSTSSSSGEVARLVLKRLRDGFHLDGMRQTGANFTAGAWVASVGIWPCTEARIVEVQRALAPMEVEVFPVSRLPRRC